LVIPSEHPVVLVRLTCNECRSLEEQHSQGNSREKVFMKFFLTRNVGDLENVASADQAPTEASKTSAELASRVDALFNASKVSESSEKKWHAIYSERFSRGLKPDHARTANSLNISRASSLSSHRSVICCPVVSSLKSREDPIRDLESKWRPVINKPVLPPPPVVTRRPVPPMPPVTRRRVTLKAPLDCNR